MISNEEKMRDKKEEIRIQNEEKKKKRGVDGNTEHLSPACMDLFRLCDR